MMESDGGFRKRNVAAVTLIAALLVAAIFGSTYFLTHSQSPTAKEPDCYVGVAFCGNTTADAKLLIDRVKSYTNLFVLQSGPVSWNETATNEVCDYAVAAGLKIVVYFGDLDYRFMNKTILWRIDWVNNAHQRWGNNLLGVYYYDEPGGIYLETDWSKYPRPFNSNSTYDSAAEGYIRGVKRDQGMVLLKNNSIPVFVSDFALYWFDYLGGYDVVLAQVAWNHTMQQDVALVRGAARLQNKDWGVILGWKYDVPPYLDSGENVYGQMVDAYAAGAKYVVLFNYPTLEDNDFGVMKEEHFTALNSFWDNVVKNSAMVRGSTEAEAALVLPRNYAWGMRHPNDRIWGYWGPDDKSLQIWNLSRSLIAEHGFRLDILYDDARFPLNNNYTKVYLWNQTN